MSFKLVEAVQGHWQAVNGPHLVAVVRARRTFEKVIVEREQQAQEAVA